MKTVTGQIGDKSSGGQRVIDDRCFINFKTYFIGVDRVLPGLVDNILRDPGICYRLSRDIDADDVRLIQDGVAI